MLLKHPENLRENIEMLNEQAWDLRHSQAERALELSQKAFELSSSGVFSEHPYVQGQAASLTTQGYLSYRLGKLDMALSQCFQVISLSEQIPSSRVTVDAWRLIGWIYYFLGDLSNALNDMLRALKMARELNLKIQEAAILDGLGVIYTASKDAPQALQNQESALRIAREANDPALEIVVLNNLAITLLNIDSLPSALELSMESIQKARELGYLDQEVSAMETLGQIYQKMGDLPKAQETLEEAIATAIRANGQLGEGYCWLSLGKIYVAKHDLGQAEAQFQRAMQIATAIGARSVQAECHSCLAGLYEEVGSLKQALEHYKQFFTINEELHSEAAEKRLATLKVAHQVETARRDTEIYRLRNVELNQEIEERSRIEAELERLATIDPLTTVFNRRHFYKLAEQELQRSIRYQHPLAVLMIDIDHFKQVNDQYGHSTGDQVLVQVTAFIQKGLRKQDSIARYGGEEFCVAMPETNKECAKMVAERIRQSVDQARFDTPSGQVAVTICVGVASLELEGKPQVYDNLDKLLDRADQALYSAKNGGRNRVEVK